MRQTTSSNYILNSRGWLRIEKNVVQPTRNIVDIILEQPLIKMAKASLRKSGTLNI